MWRQSGNKIFVPTWGMNCQYNCIVADNLESPCLNVNALWGRGIMRMCGSADVRIFERFNEKKIRKFETLCLHLGNPRCRRMCHTTKDYRYWVSGHWRKDEYVLTWSKSTKWYINCQMWISKSSLNLTPSEILGVTHWNWRRNVSTLNWDSISSQIE